MKRLKGQKYQLLYTLKGQKDYSTPRLLFYTKDEATKWLKKNKKKLYWHKLTEINPKSRRPRYIIAFDPPSDHYEMKIGKLDTHFETGMECLGLVFYEDGIHGGPNPNFDPGKPENGSNFKFYASYDALTFITHGHILQVEDGPKWGMMKDREFAIRDGFSVSFYPAGFSKFELMELFTLPKKKAKLWIKKKTEG